MNVADSLRTVESKSVKSGVLTAQEWSELLAVYMQAQRARDPLSSVGASLSSSDRDLTTLCGGDKAIPYQLATHPYARPTSP